jgi:hypothetical protein
MSLERKSKRKTRKIETNPIFFKNQKSKIKAMLSIKNGSVKTYDFLVIFPIKEIELIQVKFNGLWQTLLQSLYRQSGLI